MIEDNGEVNLILFFGNKCSAFNVVKSDVNLI